MREREEGTPQVTPREKAIREVRKFAHWNGERKDGEWVRETVATGVGRKFQRHTKSATETDDRGRPKIVTVDVEEEIYVHDGYRPHLAGEKKTRKAFFWRGARIWRE